MAVRLESRAEPIPGYRLMERLGGGGFGEVWKAEAPGGLHKAIKFVYGDLRSASDLLPDDGPGVRAEQELKALSRVKTVRHPYVLSLERFDIIDGQLIIVMELADKNLWDRFREYRSEGHPGIPRAELMAYMEETAEALDLMNGEYQLQHLDIKPQNLFLVHNHIKVADFGLVKDLEGMVASVTGGVTPVYAAPETFDGWISRFCDQYSLAIVYQELLTGVRPFTGTNVRQLVMQHLQAAPNLASLPEADRSVVARALAKNPDERYPTCGEFVRLLRTAGVEPSTETLKEAGIQKSSGHGSRVDMQLPTPTPEETEPPPTAIRPRPTEAPPRPAVPAYDPLVDSLVAVPMTVPRQPALEIHGDGVMLPAVVLGLGGTGQQVLQRFRGLLVGQFGSTDAVPHVRLLYVDTDPEAKQTVGPTSAAEALAPYEVLLARLNRPSHYLRSHEGRARLDAWMDTQMLYRIPRTPATTGVRALGRLAFCDNFKSIRGRLQGEIDECLAPETLEAACKRTGLTIRSNRPRVYLLANLAGGTGSGMFLDTAYLLRYLLRRMGYLNPDVVGLLFLPPATRQNSRGLALGNTYAALTELHHFSAPGSSFFGRYVDKERPLVDAGPPFSRCALLPLPDTREPHAHEELIGLTADFLLRDLLTPMGRLADLCRSRLPGLASSQGLVCQSFGMYRLSWPRQVLLRRLARRICGRTVERWATKDSTPLLEVVKEYVRAEWANRGLEPEGVIEHLQGAAEKALGQAPEESFRTILSSLAAPQGKAPEFDTARYAEAFAKLEKVVGRPDADTLTRPPVLVETLIQESAALVTRWCVQLETVTTELIEQPDYRLAGAEEALRQFMAVIQQTLEHYDPLAAELANRVTEARSRIESLLASLEGGRRTAQTAISLLELLKHYPKWRYQSLVLQQQMTTYVSLRGRLSDQLREINYCRARLGELQTSFNSFPGADQKDDHRPGEEFFPADCRDLDEASNHFFEALTDEDWRELDSRMQELIQREFGGLVPICLAAANSLPRLEEAMLACAAEFVNGGLAGHDVADMVLARHREDDSAKEQIAHVFDEAAPEFATARLSRQPEICILAAPATPAGERFRQLANQALPDVAPVSAACGDDIIFYREVPQLMIANLEQLGPQGQDAYQQMSAATHFTPHSRQDIKVWQPLGSP